MVRTQRASILTVLFMGLRSIHRPNPHFVIRFTDMNAQLAGMPVCQLGKRIRCLATYKSIVIGDTICNAEVSGYHRGCDPPAHQAYLSDHDTPLQTCLIDQTILLVSRTSFTLRNLLTLISHRRGPLWQSVVPYCSVSV